MSSNRDRASVCTDRLLQRAREFIDSHPDEPALRHTFTYFTRHPVARLNRRRLITLVQRVLEEEQRLGRTVRVLDLACGGGLIAETIASTGARTAGFDLDETEVGLARSFARHAEFEIADLIADTRWQQRAEAILGAPPDIVVLAYALHHLPQVETFVARLGEWLPRGALVLVNEENPRSPLFRGKHLFRTWIKRNTDEEWHRTYAGWARVLTRAHFDVSEPTGHDPIPWLASVDAQLCWSLVFSARRRPH